MLRNAVFVYLLVVRGRSIVCFDAMHMVLIFVVPSFWFDTYVQFSAFVQSCIIVLQFPGKVKESS